MCYCLSWPFKDVQYEAAAKYKNTTTGYRYQWNGQSWDLQEIQVPTVSRFYSSFCQLITRPAPCGGTTKTNKQRLFPQVPPVKL